MDEKESTGGEGSAEAIESAARDAVERGVDVRDEVRAITTAALSDGRLDAERARRVVDAVMAGASDGARADTERAREHLGEATRGVDDALTRAAQVMQLAAEEARARFAEFSERDFDKAREDLRTLESILVDSISELARRGDAVVRGAWGNLERHFRDSGTDVGRQASRAFDEAAEQLRQAGTAQAAAGWDAALGTGAQLAEVASGMLAGIADSLAAARKAPDDGAPPGKPRDEGEGRAEPKD